MRLTLLEAQYVLALIHKEHGAGYAEDERIAQLQAKLSIMLDLGQRLGDPQEPVIKVEP